MKRRTIALLAVLSLPFLAWGISITKEYACEIADIVFEGRVVSITLPSGTNDLGFASACIVVLQVSKGVLATNEVITVTYEQMCTGFSGFVDRCPPLVELQTGDVGIFAAVTNEPSQTIGKPFIPSGDFVEVKTNANNSPKVIVVPAPKPKR